MKAAGELAIEIRDAENRTKASQSGAEEINLVYEGVYGEGDVVVLKNSAAPRHVVLCLDDTYAPAFIYISAEEARFPVPSGKRRLSLSPLA